MELDQELITRLLEWRRSVQAGGGIAPPKMVDWTRAQICYHADICCQQELLQSYDHTLSGDGAHPEILRCRIGPLTSKGHDELERRLSVCAN